MGGGGAVQDRLRVNLSSEWRDTAPVGADGGGEGGKVSGRRAEVHISTSGPSGQGLGPGQAKGGEEGRKAGQTLALFVLLIGLTVKISKYKRRGGICSPLPPLHAPLCEAAALAAAALAVLKPHENHSVCRPAVVVLASCASTSVTTAATSQALPNVSVLASADTQPNRTNVAPI